MEVVSMDGDENCLTQRRFEAAVKVIKSLPPDGSFQPSNDMMLKFYSYYKQATIGPCDIPRPGFWDAVGKAKWDAWNSLGEMPKEEAMAAYVDEMKLILEGMPITEEVEALLRIIGPFYELVDEKKKITQISDLSAARLTQFARQLEGMGTMMGGLASKSMAQSIIRTMEMNGTLETIRPSARQPPMLDGSDKDEDELGEDEDEEDEEDDEEEDDEEDEDEEEVVIKEVKKEKKPSASLPKKKGSARRSKMPLSNGQLAAHMTNGTHSKASLNGEGSPENRTSSTEPQLNGHHTDSNGDAESGPQHLTSDSDSEVYCDSVDQFGQEESSENHQSIDDLDEEENHVTEEPRVPHGAPEEEEEGDPSPGPLEGIQCGGEDGEAGGVVSQRQSAPDGSLVRRGRGSRSSALDPGAPGAHVQGSGDGDGEHWGGAAGGAPGGGSLNQQIVVALARLQEDMQSVLERLHTLEALTTTQARSMALSPTYSPRPVNKSSKKPRWWPFDVSPGTVAFAVAWPFVVQWLLRLFLQRRKRRIN